MYVGTVVIIGVMQSQPAMCVGPTHESNRVGEVLLDHFGDRSGSVGHDVANAIGVFDVPADAHHRVHHGLDHGVPRAARLIVPDDRET